MNPHMYMRAIDPPRSHPPRRWRCECCGAVGLCRAAPDRGVGVGTPEVGDMREAMTKAWIVTSRDEEHSRVVYTDTRNEARSFGSGEFGDPYLDVGVRRAKEWDDKEPTITNLLAAGWHWECQGCWRHVTKYTEPPPIIDDANERAFCRAACVTKYENAEAQRIGFNAGRAFMWAEAAYDSISALGKASR